MTTTPDFDRFDQLIALEPHGPDVFVGLSPEYPWGRVYGGQVAAQALQAALSTVDEEYHPHSLHGYFIRGGTSTEPIRFEVDRIRNGRSFITRRVVARQSSGAILSLSASFHLIEGEVDVSPRTIPASIPHPDDCADEPWGPLIERRVVPAEAADGRTAVWLRVKGPLGDARGTQQLALVYASDDVPYDAAASPHPEWRPSYEDERAFIGASLDHALWFHRPGRADEWQLHMLEPMGFTGNRGLAFGQVFSADGLHLASVAQEIVLRRAR